MRVLLVEDDPRLASHTADYLGEHEVEVIVEADGASGLNRALTEPFDAILLDVMLPQMDGWEVCRRIREQRPTPVVMLTALDDVDDRVRGLEGGADDYVPKPFSPRELLARLRAVVRRRAPAAADSPAHRIGNLHVDAVRREARVVEALLELSPQQFDLLTVLAGAAPETLNRQRIHEAIQALRGREAGSVDPTVDRAIDVQVSRIRQALRDADATAEIRTVRGVGYCLRESE